MISLLLDLLFPSRIVKRRLRLAIQIQKYRDNRIADLSQAPAATIDQLRKHFKKDAV